MYQFIYVCMYICIAVCMIKPSFMPPPTNQPVCRLCCLCVDTHTNIPYTGRPNGRSSTLSNRQTGETRNSFCMTIRDTMSSDNGTETDTDPGADSDTSSSQWSHMLSFGLFPLLCPTRTGTSSVATGQTNDNNWTFDYLEQFAISLCLSVCPSVCLWLINIAKSWSETCIHHKHKPAGRHLVQVNTYTLTPKPKTSSMIAYTTQRPSVQL